MQIRFLWGADDLAAAFAVRRAVFVKEQGISQACEFDAYEMKLEHVVVYEREKPVAAGRLRFGDGWARLERICVLKSMRGNGYGKVVVMGLEYVARCRGIYVLTVHAQLEAEKFYAAQGYVRVSRQFLEVGIPHIAMEKKAMSREEYDGNRTSQSVF